MSNPESFIDEVTEEVRRDQLFAYMRRYGWIAVLLVVALVGGAAWTEYNRSQTTSAAQEAGDAILSALEADDSESRMTALAALPGTPVAALLTASEQQRAGDIDAAAATLDALAGDADVAQIYKDVAIYKSALLQGDSLEPDALKALLTPLAVPGSPMRLLAQEQMALADLRSGDVSSALEQLNRIVQDAESTAGLRDRVSGLIVSLGGELVVPASANQ